VLVREGLGNAVWIDEFLVKGRVSLRQIAKIFTMSQGLTLNKNIGARQAKSLALWRSDKLMTFGQLN
jgi:hypothetical protein